MNRLLPVEARKLLELANELARVGFPFVIMPALNDADHEQLKIKAEQRFESLERANQSMKG